MNRLSPKHEPADRPAPGARETEHSLTHTARLDTDAQPPALQAPAARPDNPLDCYPLELKTGDRFLGFTLVERLGEGAFAQVFLAEQDAIAGRRVVLKVTSSRTQEPERLGRLQHPNIVPIHSVHEHNGRELICMPFLGRHTLAHAITADRLRRDSQFPTQPAVRGSTQKSFTPKPLAAPSPDPNARPLADDLPSPSVDVNWALRLLSDLATGLDHAHRRGILHLDIKPANVLIAETGEPMLLDFNLAQETTRDESEAVGGTIPYMAPEQLAGLITRGPVKVDERTDLYGLGVVAYELLTNQRPYPAQWLSRAELPGYLALRQQPARSVRELNPLVSPAGAAIVAKLLAPDPAARYQTALELKTDLDRHLADLPLLAAPDRSVPERVQKWRRRNPWLPLRLTLACVVGLVMGFGGLLYRYDSSVRQAAAAAQAQQVQSHLTTLRLDLASPGDPLARTRGRADAEKQLAAFGLPEHSDWRTRSPFVHLRDEQKSAVANDLGEILLLLAHARWHDRDAAPEAERADLVEHCQNLVERAEGCFAPDEVPPLAAALRAEFGGARGEPVEAKTARGHYLTAVGLIAAGKFRAASAPLGKVLAADPGHAAAHFALGYCRHQRGQYARALERYDTAHALLPQDPRPVFNRGLVYGAQKKPALAEAEFTLAIEIDPGLAEAYRSRAVARLRQGKDKWAAAEDDLTAALERSAPPIPVYQLRAQVRALRDNPRGAEADRKAAKAYEPNSEGDFLARGLGRLPADPAAALADFEAAAKHNPRSLAAIQNQAHVYSDYKKDSDRALELVTRAVERYPEYAPARAGRAVLLARLGKRDAAHKEAEHALTLTDDPTVTYQLAGVFAQTSTTHPDDAARAFALLRRAIGDGFRDQRTFDADPDLNPIRKRPEFVNLAKIIKELPQ